MKWLLAWLRQNAGLKLLALALAVLLWGGLRGDPITEAVFDLPVEFSNVPQGWDLAAEPGSVQLLVRGPSRVIRRAQPEDFSVTVVLPSSPTTGDESYPVRMSNITTPSGLSPVEVTPARLRISLEETSTKVVPVHPQFSGSVPPGFGVADFSVQPSSVRIYGPRSHVTKIAFAWTDPVDLGQAARRPDATTTATLSDPRVRVVGSPEVMVSVQLRKTSSNQPNQAPSVAR